MFGVIVIVAAVGTALFGLILVRRLVPLRVLKEQHDVAGVSFAVIGGFYGVLLAFVLVMSWERFERAWANTESEANALADLHRQAAGTPEPARSVLREYLAAYAREMIDSEWPAMRVGTFSPPSQQLYADIWKTVLSMPAESAKDVALFQLMVGKLDDFSEARRYRILYMQSGLPPIIWIFLLVFGTITVAFTYFFGMPRLLPQAIITVVLASTIAFTLLIIWEMQTPFSGLVNVPDRAFRVVLTLVQRDRATKPEPTR